MNLKPQWLAPFLPPPPCPQLCPYFYISIYYIILKLFMYLLLLETISHSSLNVLLIYKIHWRIVKTWTLNDNHNRMKLESLQHKESSGKKKSLMHPCEFQPKWISPCSYLSVCCPPALGSRWRESQQVWEIGNPLSQRCAGRKYEMSMSFVIMELGIALSNSLCHRQMGKIKNGG